MSRLRVTAGRFCTSGDRLALCKCDPEEPSQCCDTGCYSPTKKTAANSTAKITGNFSVRWVQNEAAREDSVEHSMQSSAQSDGMFDSLSIPCWYRGVGQKTFPESWSEQCPPPLSESTHVISGVRLDFCDPGPNPAVGYRYAYDVSASMSRVVNIIEAPSGTKRKESVHAWCRVTRPINAPWLRYLSFGFGGILTNASAPTQDFPCGDSNNYPIYGWYFTDGQIPAPPPDEFELPNPDDEDTYFPFLNEFWSSIFDRFSGLSVTETWSGSKLIIGISASENAIRKSDVDPSPFGPSWLDEVSCSLGFTFEIDMDVELCEDPEPEAPCCDAVNPPLCRTFGVHVVGDDGRIPLMRVDVLYLRSNLIVNCTGSGGLGRCGGFGGGTFDPNRPGGAFRQTWFVEPYNISEALEIEPCSRLWRFANPINAPNYVFQVGNSWSEWTDPRPWPQGPWCPTTGDPYPLGFTPFAGIVLGEVLYGIQSGAQVFKADMQSYLVGRTGATNPVIRTLTGNLSSHYRYDLSTQTLSDMLSGTQNVMQLSGAGTGGIANLTREILPDGLCGSQADLNPAHLPTRGARVYRIPPPDFNQRFGGPSGSFDCELDVRVLFIGTADCETE